MSAPQRHIGRMNNTDQRLIVIFMQIPDREDHALIVASDSLPPRFEQALMQVVQSPEGQNAQDLGTVLARRLMPDTNVSLLTTLHTAGLLQPIPVDNIVMFPLPNQAYPLRKILESMGRLIQAPAQQFQNPYGDPVGASSPYVQDLPLTDPNDPRFLTESPTYGDPYAEAIHQAQSQDHAAATQYDPYAPAPAQAPYPYAAPTPTDLYAQPDRYNPHVQNQNAGQNERNIGIANNLLIEAKMLESEANRKREQAYQQAPSLRPAPAAPAPVATHSRTMAPRRPVVAPAEAPAAAKAPAKRAKAVAVPAPAKAPAKRTKAKG